MLTSDFMDFDASLRITLNQALGSASTSIAPQLEAAMRYSVLAPGKRVRPRLFMACAEMLNLPTGAVLPAALAIEMLHCFTLIHDDLPCMDDDDFRRGLPSNHKKFGEATALLAGDALIFTALDVFLASQVEVQRLQAGLKALLTFLGPRGVVGGQAAEFQLASHSPFSDLETVHLYKTGALFSATLQIPKLFAGIPSGSREDLAITTFARRLGLSFQAADDLEDAKPGTEIDPSHILFYLSPTDTLKRVIGPLVQASQELFSIWGTQASTLQSLAHEVIQKAEAACHDLSLDH